jgi:predicted metallo-beta-lactamase superfamily hydrolase
MSLEGLTEYHTQVMVLIVKWYHVAFFDYDNYYMEKRNQDFKGKYVYIDVWATVLVLLKFFKKEVERSKHCFREYSIDKLKDVEK